jgi:hypothetical protein
MKLPQELQTSYLHRKSYPANLVPSGTFTYKTKLASYVTRLNEAERDFCLVDSEDAIDDIFEIPIIDIGTADGKGELSETRNWSLLRLFSIGSKKFTLGSEAQRMARCRHIIRCQRSHSQAGHHPEERPQVPLYVCKTLSTYMSFC